VQRVNAGQFIPLVIRNCIISEVSPHRYIIGTAITNQNNIHENSSIENGCNSGNAYCCLVKDPLSLHVVSKSAKVKVYKTIILTVVFYGYET
jgi:hypothetical protein